MLGLENAGHNSVMWTGGVAVNTDDAALAIAHSELMALTARIKQFSESVDGASDLVYLNYADPSQNPLGSYGAERTDFLREVASLYDPTEAFQRRIPGGFKISRVK